ncbi:MAG: hypothetical protein DHS20C12_30720 [Pseudohongiella sp.]|nr:MAG: hypothetical protein DHS20C12_30720 [Pseudohongiella sp.]
MNIDNYLQRIAYGGSTEPNFATLQSIHRHHCLAIPYENIDVIMQTPVSRNLENIHEKIVTKVRGGWCYEMNGLLGWALEALGFKVTPLCGGVMRSQFGDAALANHLVLRIDLEHSWIADSGLGDGILEPLPLVAGSYRQRGSDYTLEQLEEGSWRFHNRTGSMPPDYDFFNQRADEALLDKQCAHLQQDPESMFRKNLICQLMTENGGYGLLGKVLTNQETGERRYLIDGEDLREVLVTSFKLVPPPLQGLWELVERRHVELFGDKSVDEISIGSPMS